jgi:hypothetical protein
MTTQIVAFYNFEKACKNGLTIRYLERDQTTDAPKHEARMLSTQQRNSFSRLFVMNADVTQRHVTAACLK